jgi:hypothetical protein
MKPIRALFLFLAVAAPVAAEPEAAAEPVARILSYGRFETRIQGAPFKDERVAGGERQMVQAHRLLEQTEEIPGMLGTSFGVVMRFENFPPEPQMLTIRVLHPPITHPKTGQTLTVSEYPWEMGVLRDNAYFGYQLGYSWLIAEGIWTHQFVYKGRVIAEKKFKVVVPLN